MYNKVILIGRLTATPEMVKTASDRSFTRVTVAVNRRYKTQNGERQLIPSFLLPLLVAQLIFRCLIFSDKYIYCRTHPAFQPNRFYFFLFN